MLHGAHKMSSFDEFQKYFTDIRSIRSTNKTNRYGGEIIRINQNARTKLEQMHKVTKISKRALGSFAMFLLFKEFEKWLAGDQNAEFGYDVEEYKEDETT